jgi:hypothetical protein
VNVTGNAGIIADSVSDSVAMNCRNVAILAGTVQNSKGVALGSGYGVQAKSASNCYGESYGGGIGIYATTANNCTGIGNSGDGIYAPIGVVTGCYGYSYFSNGIEAFMVNGSHGVTVIGSPFSSPHLINSF